MGKISNIELKKLENLYKLNKLTDLEKETKRLLQIEDNNIILLNILGVVYLKKKLFNESEKIFKKIYETNPKEKNALKILDKDITNRRALSSYLFNQNYNPQINQKKIDSYLKKFNQPLEKKLNIVNYSFNKNPEKLNVGFVSPDFRNHPVGYALTKVIKELKSYNFNLFAYYNFTLEDDLTNKFKNDFDNFYNITNLTDEEAINKIRSDGIHILIDLAGYTFNNRLSIFFYKPAPIQISWLGYLPTTGIKEIKYKIGDPYIYPESTEKNFSEEILRFSNIWSDFFVKENVEISHNLSKKDDKEIIFGCFVTLRKINEKVIKLWSRVLKKFPHTKIFFKSPELNDALIADSLKKNFFNYGIDADRLILEKSSDYKTYLNSYSKVHITLDPFPWNGATTSFESIWMGVPIFCLKGDELPYSKCAYSINKNLKMDSWIAEDERDYLEKLEKILNNRKELFSLKKDLRNNAIKNNIFNSSKLSKDLSKLLNKVWKNFIIE